MGEAFWKPRMTPVLPSHLAVSMSETERTWRISEACWTKRGRQWAMWSRVSWVPSQVAMVALMAVTPPLTRLRKTAGLSQLLTLSPSTT